MIIVDAAAIAIGKVPARCAIGDRQTGDRHRLAGSDMEDAALSVRIYNNPSRVCA